jgi:hypothetical protein
MLLKLVRKNVAGDTNALVAMVEYGEEDKPKKKWIQSINVGAAIDVPEELGYAIMGKYPKCFMQLSTKEKTSAAEVK